MGTKMSTVFFQGIYSLSNNDNDNNVYIKHTHTHTYIALKLSEIEENLLYVFCYSWQICRNIS